MTIDLHTAAKQALEALEYIYEGANNQGPHTGISWRCASNKVEPAITALRQALANEAKEQPRAEGTLAQQEPVENYCRECLTYNGHHEGCSHYVPDHEPVAWQWLDTGNFRKNLPSTAERGAWRPLYTRTQAREPLTDEDLIECERLAAIRHRKHMGSIRGQQLSPADQFLWHYARAIEAAHGIGEKEGKCEICNDPSNLVIDHCHNSKDVRGILCWSCNVALGHFKDSEERLTSALEYLCKFKQNTQTL